MAKKPKPSPPRLIQQSEEAYGSSFKAHLFEQYKLYLASAEKISERRVTANNYFLTVNAFLVTLYGLAVASRYRTHWTILVPITGILVAVTWHRIITSYRDLNTVKFDVIHELEQRMPAALYLYEWEKAEHGRGKAYRPLSHLERWIPIIFVILYAVLGIVSAFMKEEIGLAV